jgi:hypothetical protein
LLKRDYSGGNLVIKECISALGINRFHSRRDDWIARHRERKAVNDYATQLLALYVDTLPEGGRSE